MYDEFTTVISYPHWLKAHIHLHTFTHIQSSSSNRGTKWTVMIRKNNIDLIIYSVTDLGKSRLNLASAEPMFLMRIVLMDLCLTGADGKLILSGKSSSARAPMACTGMTNFSLSVMHTIS